MQQGLFNDSALIDQRNSKIVNVASVPQRSPFRYPGGKTWFVPTLRKWLQSKSTKPKLLVEPFAGGGIVGLTTAFEKMAEKVLLIEKDPYVASVWTVLIHGDYEKLANRILNFDLNINNVQEELSYPGTSSDDKAFQTILRNRVSHGGIMAPGSGFIKNGENGKGISSRWYPETLARRIRDIGLVRDKIKFIEGDAFAIIESYLDDPQTVFFVDPPYTAAGKRAGRRLYTHSGLDHDSLFDMFLDAKSDFLFTYDNSDDLIDMAKSRRFETKLIPMKNTHHAEMSELIVSRNLDWLTQ